jgi:hypothetical protein
MSRNQDKGYSQYSPFEDRLRVEKLENMFGKLPICGTGGLSNSRVLMLEQFDNQWNGRLNHVP